MYNTWGMYIPNELKPAFKQHCMRVKPPAMLFLDDPGFAVEMKRALPGTTVTYRKWYPPQDKDGDNSVHTRVKDPRELLNVYLSEISPSEGIHFHLGNEPSASDELFDWSEAAARYVEETRAYGTYLNFSVGTPQPADWRKPSAQRFLRTIARTPARHVVGLHEYVPTGVWKEFGLSPDPATWPARVNGTSYLIGRYRELLTACDAMGIRRPRIVMTEFGFDFIHAVQDWQNNLPRTGDYKDIGALWTNVTAWEQMMPAGYTWPRYMVEQLHWIWRAIYRWDGIEGVCNYCYGSHGDWRKYDHMNVPELFKLVEAKDWSRMSTPSQPQPSHWIKEITWNTGMKFRAAPSLSAPQIAVIQAGVTVQAIGNVKVAEGYAWIPVTFNGVPGWSALGAV